jgi:hypothetical protein
MYSEIVSQPLPESLMSALHTIEEAKGELSPPVKEDLRRAA